MFVGKTPGLNAVLRLSPGMNKEPAVRAAGSSLWGAVPGKAGAPSALAASLNQGEKGIVCAISGVCDEESEKLERSGSRYV